MAVSLIPYTYETKEELMEVARKVIQGGLT
jgi:hypothetical protein